MNKTKRYLWKIFVLMVVMFSAVFANRKEVSAASAPVEFINVAQHNTDGQKGDAILITYKNKYYLVDTGVEKNYKPDDSVKTALEKRLQKLKDSGKSLSGIIITHSHADHMGALLKIVNKSELVNKNTTLYCNNAHITATMEKAITAAKAKNVKVVKVKKGEVYNVATGELKSVNYAKANNGLFLYGTTIAKENVTTKEAENNASMIVQLKTNEYKALLLGDLLLGELLANGKARGGVRGAYYYYGPAITGIHYNVCKVGHHGIRKSANRVNLEYNEFYSKFTADIYMNTVTTKGLIGFNYFTMFGAKNVLMDAGVLK